MVFEVRDYYDFVRLLYQHPEWQEELGNLLIAKEIRELPQLVRELTEAQKRTEQRVEELAEAQKRSEERLSGVEERVARLETAVAELAEAQKRTEQRVEELAEAQKHTEEQLKDLAKSHQRLTERVDKLTTRVGEVSGYMLEGRYRQRPLAYFGRLLAQAQVVEVNEVIPAENNLTEDELQELLVLDVLLRGQLWPSIAEQVGISEVWLAVEISGQVEYPDVERAWQRAKLLKDCGLWPVVGVVGGKEITENAQDAANKKKVLVELERRLVNVDEILTALQAGSGREEGKTST